MLLYLNIYVWLICQFHLNWISNCCRLSFYRAYNEPPIKAIQIGDIYTHQCFILISKPLVYVHIIIFSVKFTIQNYTILIFLKEQLLFVFRMREWHEKVTYPNQRCILKGGSCFIKNALYSKTNGLWI